MSDREQIHKLLQKVAELKRLTDQEAKCITSFTGSSVTRSGLVRVMNYMQTLEDNITYFVQDGIMSDTRSLADANRHHEQGKKIMRETTSDMGLGPMLKRTRRSGRNQH